MTAPEAAGPIASCHPPSAAGADGLVAASVFLAGLLTTIMPCTVQMAVVLAGLLSDPHGGIPAGAGEARSSRGRAAAWLLRLASFLGGFAGTFTAAAGAAGLLAGAVGWIAGGAILQVAGGAVLAAFGMQMLGWVRLPGGGSCRGPLAFFLGRPYHDPPRPARLGASFALYCAGCCGPAAVGSALLLTGGASPPAIAACLLAYGAGMAIPFVVLASGIALAFRAARAAARLAPAVAAAGACTAVVAGTLLALRPLAAVLAG